jgi:hypothetical protein
MAVFNPGLMPGPESLEVLEMWVIYDHPADYPDHYVVRRWAVVRGESHPDPICQMAPDVESARLLIPRRMWNLGRYEYESDDRAVMEVWI